MARGVGGIGNLDIIHEEYNNHLHTNEWKGWKLGIEGAYLNIYKSFTIFCNHMNCTKSCYIVEKQMRFLLAIICFWLRVYIFSKFYVGYQFTTIQVWYQLWLTYMTLGIDIDRIIMIMSFFRKKSNKCAMPALAPKAFWWWIRFVWRSLT